jgi:hypothetical protein
VQASQGFTCRKAPDPDPFFAGCGAGDQRHC